MQWACARSSRNEFIPQQSKVTRHRKVYVMCEYREVQRNAIRSLPEVVTACEWGKSMDANDTDEACDPEFLCRLGWAFRCKVFVVLLGGEERTIEE